MFFCQKAVELPQRFCLLIKLSTVAPFFFPQNELSLFYAAVSE